MKLMRYVYLHGFASSPNSRKALAFARALGTVGKHLEIPSLEDNDFPHITLSRQLQVLEDLLQNEPACLIGSSMGGYLATRYASTHPEIDRLVLLAPAFAFMERWEHLAGTARLTSWRETGFLDIFHYGQQRMTPVHYALYTDSLLHPAYPRVTQPSLIFHGTADTVVPLSVSQAFAARNPSAALVPLESDHELINVLERLTREGVQFIMDIPASESPRP